MPRRRGALKIAGQPRRHAAAVRHTGDEHPGAVDAAGSLQLVERALERLDVAGAGGLAGEVPERVRSARRRIGDEEALPVGQPAEAGVVGEVAAGLARAVQGDDQRPRLLAPGGACSKTWRWPSGVSMVSVWSPGVGAGQGAGVGCGASWTAFAPGCQATNAMSARVAMRMPAAHAWRAVTRGPPARRPSRDRARG